VTASKWDIPLGTIDFHGPTRITAGIGRRREVHDVIRSVGSTRALVMCGSHFAGSTHFDDIVRSLSSAYVGCIDGISSYSTIDDLRDGVATVMETGADVLVAIGGGSVIDLAKCVAATQRAGVDFLDIHHSIDKPNPSCDERQSCNIIALPTTAGSASETNCMGGVLASDETGHTYKVPVRDPHVAPRTALLDPELTVSLSPWLTVTTGANAFAHCVESLYSKDADPVSTGIALEAARIMYEYLPRCVKDPGDLTARAFQQFATAMSGLAMGNTMVALHHALCHGLGDLHCTPHGVCNAVMLPHALRYNADTASFQIHRLGIAIGVADSSESTEVGAYETIDAIQSWLIGMGAPTRLRDVGTLRLEDLIQSAKLASQSPCIPFNPTPPPSVEELLQIYQDAW
jgi:alcohol dehydrogenase class IV